MLRLSCRRNVPLRATTLEPRKRRPRANSDHLEWVSKTLPSSVSLFLPPLPPGVQVSRLTSGPKATFVITPCFRKHGKFHRKFSLTSSSTCIVYTRVLPWCLTIRLIVFYSNPCRTECCFVSFCCHLLCLWTKTSTFSIYKASYLLLTSIFLCYMPSVNYEGNLIIINYIISSVMHAFWLVLTCDLLEDRHIDDVIIKTFFLILYYIKQIDSKLPCVWSVIDHRGRQNVVRTSAAPRVPLFCSYHILTSSVIYYWTDARQLGIYLLII